MTTKIWKFAAPLKEVFELTVMNGAKPLAVQMQSGFDDPQLWMEVDEHGIKINMRFQWVGTGHDVPPFATYVGTVQTGRFVWHLYSLDT